MDTHTDEGAQLHEAQLRIVNASVCCFFTFYSVVSAVMCLNSSGSRRNDLLCTVLATSVCGAKKFLLTNPKICSFSLAHILLLMTFTLSLLLLLSFLILL